MAYNLIVTKQAENLLNNLIYQLANRFNNKMPRHDYSMK